MTASTSPNKRLETITPQKSMGGKSQSGPVGSNFDSFLGAVDAMSPMGEQLTYQASGSSNAAAVLHGAFSGVTGAAAAYGAGPASTMGVNPGAGGFGTGGFGLSSLSTTPGIMGVGSSSTLSGFTGVGYKADGISTGVSDTQIAGSGATALSTSDLLNSMNVNNLQLLELQAVMQSNMQGWNTKSNILSADHRARMSMIEKFTAR